jgi:hypothetical protein
MAGWLHRALLNDLAPTAGIICVKFCEEIFRFDQFKIIGHGPPQDAFLAFIWTS